MHIWTILKIEWETTGSYMEEESSKHIGEWKKQEQKVFNEFISWKIVIHRKNNLEEYALDCWQQLSLEEKIIENFCFLHFLFLYCLKFL